MSRTIDEKVVQLKFDNSNFEKNVSTSMSTLEKFQNALKFDGATKGLDDIEKAAKKCDISPLEKGVESLTLSFKSLDVIAVTALQNITNRVVDFGLQLARSMSGFDLVKSGWNKMDEMTGSVQTLVNSTGLGVDEITRYLNKLMVFSDETSFGFNDMTSALATMTASGGNIEKLIPMIEGIANATAYAGKTAGEFKRVIYNLNQSYSAGHLQLMDWKSVQLAGVNSKALMETLIQTGEELGKINKGTVTLSNFTETLKDKWADTEVMEVAFNKFAAMTEAAQELYEAGEVDTFSKAYEKLSGKFDEIAERAAKSAQEAKTFKEAIDSVVDAASSKWLKVFSLMFGNYEEAKVLWTDVANSLYDLFVTPLDDFAENVITPAFTSRWEDFSKIIADTGASLESFEKGFIDFGEKHGVDIKGIIEKYGSLKAALSSGEIGKNFLSDFIESISKGEQAIENVSDKLTAFQKVYDEVWNGDFGTGEDRFKKLTEAGYDYAEVQGLINKLASEGHRAGYKLTIEDLDNLSDAELRTVGFTQETIDKFRALSEEAKTTGSDLSDVIDSITRPSGRDLLAGSIRNLIGIFINLQKAVNKAWSAVFQKGTTANIVYSLVNALYRFTETIRNLTEESTFLGGVFEGLFSVLNIVGKAFEVIKTVVGQIVRGGLDLLQRIFQNLNIDFSKFSELVGNSLDKIKDWIEENDVFTKAIDGIATSFETAYKAISTWAEKVLDLQKVKDFISGFTSGFANFKIGNLHEGLQPLTNFVDDVKSGKIDLLQSFASNMGELFANIASSAGKAKDSIVKTLSTIKNPIKVTDEELDQITTRIQRFTETVIGLGAGYLTINALTKFGDAFSNLTKPLKTISDVFESVSYVGYSLSNYINAMTNNIKTNNILKIALAIGALALALFLLAKIDQGALWSAVGAVTVLSLVIAGLSIAVSKSSGLVSGSRAGNIDHIAKFLLAMAAAILILAIALKKVDSLKNGITDLIVIGGLIAALTFSAKAISANAKDMTEVAWMLIGFAAAIYVMAGALKKLESINFEHFGKTMLAFVACIGAMFAAAYAVKGIDKSSGLAILALSGSMYLLATSFEKFGNIDGEKYYKGLLTMIPVIGIMMLVLKTASKVTANTGTAAWLVVGLAASIYLMAEGIEKLGTIKPGVLIKGGLAASALMLVVGGIAALFAKLSTGFGTVRQAASMAVIVLALSASLYLMAGAVMIFKNMDEEGLWKAVKAISYLEVAFGVMMALISSGRNFDYNDIKVLTTMAITLGILAAAVFVLSFIPTEQLIATVTGLVVLITTLGIIFKLIGTIPDTGKVAATVAMMAVLIGAIAGTIYLLTTAITDVDKATQIAEALGELMVKLGAGMLLIASAGAIAKFIDPGSVLKIAAVVTAIGAVMSALGGIMNSIPGSIEAMDTAIVFLGKVGEGIGKLVGGLLGGIAGGAYSSFTSVLPAVAESLSTFTENIKPFLELSVSDSFMNSVNGIKDMIIGLGSGQFINSLKNLANNSENMDDYTKFFTKFGTAVVAFSRTVSGQIDTAAVEAASNAGRMMAELAKNLPASGGLLQWFTGENKDLDKFGIEMVSFGGNLVAMSEKLKDFKLDAVEKAEAAGKMFASLAESLPGEGGLWQKLTGEQNLETFGKQIEDFATSLVTTSSILKLYDDSSVDKAKKAGETMRDLATTIPESGSLKSLLFGGEQSLNDFGNGIANFAAGLVNMSTLLTSDPGFNEESPEIAKKAAETLSAIISSASNTEETGVDISTLGTSLTDIGNGLVAMGIGVQQFASAISIVDLEKTQSFIATLFDMVGNEFLNTADQVEQVIDAGRDWAYNFGVGVNDPEIRESILHSIEEFVNTILDILDKQKEAKDIGKNILIGFRDGLSTKSIIDQIMAKADEIATGVADRLRSALSIHSPSKVTEEIGRFVGLGLIKGLTGVQGAVGDAAEETSNIVTESLRSAIYAANSVLEDDLNPVITPVLDLSQVQDNAGSISDMLAAKSSFDSALAIDSNSPYGNNQNGATTNSIIMENTFKFGSIDEFDRGKARGIAEMLLDEMNTLLGEQV